MLSYWCPNVLIYQTTILPHMQHMNVVGGRSKLIFHSHSSVVYLDFRSDEYVNERGFLIEYNATLPPGKIQMLFSYHHL